MGSCSIRKSKKNKRYSIKMKTQKNRKSRNRNGIEEIDFTIIDTTHNLTTEKIIKNNATLSELLTSVDYNINGDLDIHLDNSKKINGDMNTNLKDIISKFYPGKNLSSLTLFVTNKGLSIPSNIIKNYQEMTPIIGNPIFENYKKFGISLYYKKLKTLKTFYFDKSNYQELIKFNSFSSYCSARGKLYISGGEKEQKRNIKEDVVAYNDFFSIDMNKLNKFNLCLKELPNLIESRTWHSMIFVPYQYIFIVGGLNTRTVEIYDIEENEIFLDSELNEKRCEPTMCVINNIYLYAFCGFYPYYNFNDTIERCNLLKKKREWEYIEYSGKINPSFFGISYFKKDEILLISPKDSKIDDNKSYIYKIGKDEDTLDEVEEIKINYNNMKTFRDKLFYPIFDNHSINLPLIVGENKNVLLLNINTGEIQCETYK